MDVIMHLIDRDHLLWVLSKCSSFLHEGKREDAAKVVGDIYDYVRDLQGITATYSTVKENRFEE